MGWYQLVHSMGFQLWRNGWLVKKQKTEKETPPYPVEVEAEAMQIDGKGNNQHGTAGDTTYRPSRFLFVEKKPQPNETFELDFNRTYNPPCAFSAFTTCPLPPKQNILKTRIEAGEQVRKQS